MHAALFVVVLIGFSRTFDFSQWFRSSRQRRVLARLAFWPLLGGSGVAGGPLFAVAGMLACVLALAAYERRTLGRVHRATWGGTAIIVASIGIGTAVALTGLEFAAF